MTASTTLKVTLNNVVQMQQFDPALLDREHELGPSMRFSEASAYAQWVVDTYKKIPIPALELLPAEDLDLISEHAQNDFHIFQEILNFTVSSPNACDTRSALIDSLRIRATLIQSHACGH